MDEQTSFFRFCESVADRGQDGLTPEVETLWETSARPYQILNIAFPFDHRFALIEFPAILFAGMREVLC